MNLKTALAAAAMIALASMPALAVKKYKTDTRGHVHYICNYWGTGGRVEIIKLGGGKFRIYGGNYKGVIEVGEVYNGVSMTDYTYTNAARVACGETDE